jgi:hypothetical protein
MRRRGDADGDAWFAGAVQTLDLYRVVLNELPPLK